MHCALRGTGLAACLLLCGCNYVKNRVNDLLDPFRFDVGIGPGLYAEARATDFAAVGVGARFQEIVAMHGRFVSTDIDAFALGLGPFVLGSHHALDLQPLLAADPSEHDADHGVVAAQFLFFPSMGMKCEAGYELANRGLRLADLGGTLALGYVGVGAGLSPGEFVDLLLGFVGIDIAGDDGFGRPEPPAEEPTVPEPETK